MTAPTHEEMVAALRKAISDRKAELWPGDYSHLEALRAALQTLEDQRWRPIETAPKSQSRDVPGGKLVTGVYILGFCPEEGVRPESCISVIWWEPNIDGGVWYGEASHAVNPTHWRPLPEPPSDDKEKGA